MTRSSSVLLGVAVAGAVFASGVTWHGLRQEARARSHDSRELAERFGELSRECTRMAQRSAVSARLLHELRGDLRELLDAWKTRSQQLLDAAPPAATAATPDPPDESVDAEGHALGEAAPLPLEVEAAAPSILKRFRKSLNISEVLENASINPDQKKPESLEALRIQRELVQANAKIDILTSDYHLSMVEGRTQLAEAQQYVDYAPGAKYVVEPGVLTVGETTETGDTRIYYLYPDEFPQPYELRESRRAVARVALRKVRDILQEVPVGQ